MKSLRSIIIFGVISLSIPSLHAQDFLQKAKNYLEAGDCENARKAYDAYKVECPQGNAEVERRIAECGRAEDFIFNIKGEKYKMIHVEGGPFKIEEDIRHGNRETIYEYDTTVFDEDGNVVSSFHISSSWAPCTPQSQGKVIQINDFYIGEFEVTQKLWYDVMGTTIFQQGGGKYNKDDFYGVGAYYPMYYVNYYEAQQFCDKLNMLLEEKLPAGYRIALPTGNEWKYAAQGSNKSKSYQDYSDKSYDKGNSNESTHMVGSEPSNPLGLFDMSDNVSEWCDDIDDTKSTAMAQGGDFVLYKGINTVCWQSADARLRNCGFRLALVRR